MTSAASVSAVGSPFQRISDEASSSSKPACSERNLQHSALLFRLPQLAITCRMTAMHIGEANTLYPMAQPEQALEHGTTGWTLAVARICRRRLTGLAVKRHD